MSMATETSLARYWDTIGLKPGADVEKLDTTYYLLVERFPKEPTEQDGHRLEELAHAYAVLRRSLVAKDTRVAVARGTPRRDKRKVTAVVALILGAAVLLFLNLGELELAVISYGPGDVLRLKGQNTVYGTVRGYESDHRFHTGDPSPAYQIELAGSQEVIWVSERVVEKGMEK